MAAQRVKDALQALADPERARASAWFFQTGPGGYGEGDRFIGLTMPQQRRVARQFADLPLAEVLTLLRSPVHEHRHTALLILVHQYRKGDAATRKAIAGLYHKNRAYINNWDLIDGSAPHILGDYLLTHSPNVLFRLARSASVWDRRMAIISTFAWVRLGQFDLTLRLAETLLGDREDLVHKAVGWALREVGKKDEAALTSFLDAHAATMPRTSLRYAIERLPPERRRHYMGLKRSRAAR